MSTYRCKWTPRGRAGDFEHIECLRAPYIIYGRGEYNNLIFEKQKKIVFSSSRPT